MVDARDVRDATREARCEASPGESDFLLRDARRRLLAQIAWFNRLRFVAVASMAVLIVVAHLGGALADVAPLVALAVATLLANLGYLVWYRGLDSRRPAALRRHVHLQVGVDLVILTLILHHSGGVTNPLVLSYLFHTFITAFLLSLRAAVVVAAGSVLLLVGLTLAESGGLLPHHPFAYALFDLERVSPVTLVVWLGMIAAVLGLSVYFVSTIVRQLYKRDEVLLGLSRQLALSEKLASIGTLAAGVSHEINNPVGVIKNRAGILRYRIGDGDAPEQLLHELDIIEKHTRRIGAITDGLLAFAREAPFELRPVRVNALVREGADLVRVPYKSADLGLDLRLDPRELEVEGSPNHLLQVLVNVLLNARDASPEGGRVSMSTGLEVGQVVVRIRDSGEGIPPEHLDKIFDPFFTTKDVDRGTGLGLALSHGIVERHGGRIEVESEPGAGTSFSVWLPPRAES